MKPWVVLGTITAEGVTLTLARHDREFLLLADGLPLMSSRMHGSEDDLGALYADQGIAAARAALKPAGLLAVWSSFADRQFARRLRNGGFDVVMERVRGRPRRGPKKRNASTL